MNKTISILSLFLLIFFSGTIYFCVKFNLEKRDRGEAFNAYVAHRDALDMCKKENEKIRAFHQKGPLNRALEAHSIFMTFETSRFGILKKKVFEKLDFYKESPQRLAILLCRPHENGGFLQNAARESFVSLSIAAIQSGYVPFFLQKKNLEAKKALGADGIKMAKELSAAYLRDMDEYEKYQYHEEFLVCYEKVKRETSLLSKEVGRPALYKLAQDTDRMILTENDLRQFALEYQTLAMMHRLKHHHDCYSQTKRILQAVVAW